MASGFTVQVERILKTHGCHFVRTGRHPIWYSPITKINFPVPQNIMSRHTANAVMKQAGLPKQF